MADARVSIRLAWVRHVCGTMAVTANTRCVSNTPSGRHSKHRWLHNGTKSAAVPPCIHGRVCIGVRGGDWQRAQEGVGLLCACVCGVMEGRGGGGGL